MTVDSSCGENDFAQRPARPVLEDGLQHALRGRAACTLPVTGAPCGRREPGPGRGPPLQSGRMGSTSRTAQPLEGAAPSQARHTLVKKHPCSQRNVCKMGCLRRGCRRPPGLGPAATRAPVRGQPAPLRTIHHPHALAPAPRRTPRSTTEAATERKARQGREADDGRTRTKETVILSKPLLLQRSYFSSRLLSKVSPCLLIKSLGGSVTQAMTSKRRSWLGLSRPIPAPGLGRGRPAGEGPGFWGLGLYLHQAEAAVVSLGAQGQGPQPARLGVRLEEAGLSGPPCSHNNSGLEQVHTLQVL